MASNVDQGGYEVNFTSEIPDELRCLICQLVLREPVQIMTCGHRFCGTCFERMRDHAQKTNMDLQCPVDREVVDLGQVYPDKAAHRTIGNLKVQCGNHDQGCPWIDDLRDLQKHEERCEFRIVTGVQDMMVANRRHEELNNLIQQIMSRLLSCENDLLAKDKELSYLKVTVSELKEDNKLKDEEIQILKSSISELKTVSASQDKEVSQLKESIETIQNDMETTKSTANEHKEDINKLQVMCTEMEEEMKDQLNEKSKMQNQMSLIKALQDESSNHLKNIENVLFAHKRLPEMNEVSLLWVMQDFAKKFCLGEDVCSPIFHTKVCSYSFQLQVQWRGINKEKMGLFLRLHRGETPHNLLKDFSHEFTLTFHGKKGKTKSYRYSQTEITKYKDTCFMIKEGKDCTGKVVGNWLLTAPYDTYIINDSLLTTCTFHI